MVTPQEGKADGGHWFPRPALPTHEGDGAQEAVASLLPLALIGRLWGLVLLLLIGGAVLSLLPIPRHASGQGLLLPAATATDSARLLVLFPADAQAPPRVGQPLTLDLTPHERVQLLIEQVEPTLLDPATVQQRFALAVTEPSVLVMARWPAESRLPTAGRWYAVQAEVGKRTLLSLLLPDLASGRGQP